MISGTYVQLVLAGIFTILLISIMNKFYNLSQGMNIDGMVIGILILFVLGIGGLLLVGIFRTFNKTFSFLTLWMLVMCIELMLFHLHLYFANT